MFKRMDEVPMTKDDYLVSDGYRWYIGFYDSNSGVWWVSDSDIDPEDLIGWQELPEVPKA